MKMVNLYLYKNMWLITTASKSTGQFWFQEGECSSLPVSAEDTLLGVVVRKHLDASRQGVARRIDANNDKPSVLQAAGVKSWINLEKGSRTVDVCESDRVHVLPYSTFSRTNGFQPLHTSEVFLSLTVSNAELGRVIRAAIHSVDCR